MVVERLLESQNEVSIVVDVDWENNYIGRNQHPVQEAEGVIFDENYNVDKSADMILRYENGKNAFISSGFNNYYQSEYSVWGSMAKISTKRAYAVPPHYETSVFLHQDDQIFETVIDPVDQFKIMFDTFCLRCT